MSTTTSVTSASNTTAASLITVQTFSGQSTYSSDFQQILSKAVTVQEIPLDGLVDQVNTLTKRQSALSTLDSDFTSLQTAVTSLVSSVGQSALSTSVSSSAASASLSTGASAGNYQLEIDSLGSTTQTISTGSPNVVTNPGSTNLSSSSAYTLTVNGTAYTIGTGPSSSINLASNTMTGLMTAINSNSATLGVTASIVNVGSSNSPDYRLAVQTTALNSATIQLSDGTNNLLQDPPIQTGSQAQYKVDGLSNTISSTSDTIALAPGLSVNLLQTTTAGNPVSINVGQTTDTAGNALQTFVTAYNQAITDLAAQHGQNGGALQGESVLLVAKQALSEITGYSSTSGSALTGISALGLTVTDSGALSFDATAFEQQLGGNFSQLSTFLGDATSGFLGAATNSLASLENSTTGAIKTEESSITSTLTSVNTKITDAETNINNFQNNLVAQLAKSDAAIASLQSQNTFFEDLFKQMQTDSSS